MENHVQDQQEVEWIRRAQGGEAEAFRLLVERYQRKVSSLVFHIIRRPDETEDLSQEIFVKVFRSIRGYNFQAPFRSWIARIAVNHCYDYLRRQRASKLTYFWQLSDEARQVIESSPEPKVAGKPDVEQETVLKDLVRKLLDRAPPEDRLVLVMKEMENLSIEEIGGLLNWSTSKVKVRLHRARKRLLADLKRWR